MHRSDIAMQDVNVTGLDYFHWKCSDHIFLGFEGSNWGIKLFFPAYNGLWDTFFELL